MISGMADREKIIQGLKCCTAGFMCKKEICPYYGKSPVNSTCSIELEKDALVLLKAQEPRVMTLEEVLGGDECWIETRNGICGYGDAVLTGDGELVDFYRSRNINTFDFYEYGLSWRCWTFRPTDEQRKVTPWETGTTNGEK